MKELRGVITREELEAYGGAEIAMLDAGNDSTSSDKTLTGSGEYYWSLTYNDSGFSGYGWKVTDWEDLTHMTETERETYISENTAGIAIALGTQRHPCASMHEVQS